MRSPLSLIAGFQANKTLLFRDVVTGADGGADGLDVDKLYVEL